MFFDNQSNNCVDVSKVNVTVAYVPDGITRLVKEIFVLSIADYYILYRKDNKIYNQIFRSAFEEALKQYPAPGQILGPKLRSGWW